MEHIDSSQTVKEEESSTSDTKRGGWITFPFILVTVAGLNIGGLGWLSNLIVYLIEEFNVKSIDAALVYNIFNGTSSFMPLIGAIIADSFFGCFSVIFISSLISLLGLVLITLTSTLDFLRPESCTNTSTSTCDNPSKLQLAFLYTSLALACLGQGGIRFTLATFGANQFDKPKEQAIFFNWFFVAIYTASIVTSTATVYVQDNISWGWGYGISVGANVIGFSFFLMGSRFYLRIGPQGSPFTSIARVVVASIRKRKMTVGITENEDYWHGLGGETSIVVPTKSFKFLNRAALKSGDEINQDSSIAKPWKLCSVQQVEDLKTLIRIVPLGSTSIFLFTPIGILASLVVLQACTMDRRLGDHFKVPAASMLVFLFISTCISLTLFDKLLWPMWRKIIGRPPTPLQQIGVGHVLNILSMAVAALVESKRLHVAHDTTLQTTDSVIPISVMWLVPQLVVNGIAEAFQFPGQVALFYHEFPITLKTISTSIVALLFAVALYLSAAVIGLIQRVTGWLPDDINDGRIDNVYWVCVVIGLVNFVYYLVCAFVYKYQNVEAANKESSNSS